MTELAKWADYAYLLMMAVICPSNIRFIYHKA